MGQSITQGSLGLKGENGPGLSEAQGEPLAQTREGSSVQPGRFWGTLHREDGLERDSKGGKGRILKDRCCGEQHPRQRDQPHRSPGHAGAAFEE